MSSQNAQYAGICVIAAEAREAPEPLADDEKAGESIRACIGRARHTCAGCGYVDKRTSERITGVMTAHPIDGDHAHISVKGNLVPVCPICHDILHVGYAPAHDRGEVLLGGFITQHEITAMARLCMVAQHNNERFKDTAAAYYERLRNALWSRTRELLGKQYDGSPETFGNLLQSEPFAQRVSDPQEALSDARYLPSLTGYTEAVEFWAETQFAVWPEAEWLNYAD